MLDILLLGILVIFYNVQPLPSLTPTHFQRVINAYHIFFCHNFSVLSYVAAVVTRRSSIKMICSGTIQFLEVD